MCVFLSFFFGIVEKLRSWFHRIGKIDEKCVNHENVSTLNPNVPYTFYKWQKFSRLREIKCYRCFEQSSKRGFVASFVTTSPPPPPRLFMKLKINDDGDELLSSL